jgi:hypothetical protein
MQQYVYFFKKKYNIHEFKICFVCNAVGDEGATSIEDIQYDPESSEPSSSEYRMDAEDFVRAAQQLDDVLVAALLRKPRSKMAELFRRLERENDGDPAVVSQRLQDHIRIVLSSSSAMSGQDGVLPALMSPGSTPFVIASAVGRAVLGFATGGGSSSSNGSASK